MKNKIIGLLTEEPHLHIDVIRMLIIEALQSKDEDTLQNILIGINLRNYKEFKT